jgi:D-alanyl-D-alanine carboxypeptidase
MSAGESSASLLPNHDFAVLAPKFRVAVDRAIRAANDKGLDAIVYETYRSQQLQEAYYARGRTQVPPVATVTNARSNLYSWHGYGLAVDVISKSKQWDVGADWFASVAECFRVEGCRWGGEWKMKDLPHFQWGPCKPSPSDMARQLYASGGLEAVWDAVGAS